MEICRGSNDLQFNTVSFLILERILTLRWMISIITHCHYHFGKSIEFKVDFQQSNGRIHSAVITGVNAEVQSVTVEWFEGGETKGKEVRT